MKKFALLLSAVLTLGGLLVIGASSASAVVYPGTVKTHTLVAAQNTYTHAPGDKAQVSVNVTVTAAAGNADPTDGTLTLTVRKIKNNGNTPVVRTKTVNYTGGTISVDLGKYNDGNFQVTAKYLASAGSIYKNSKDTDSFTVEAAAPAPSPLVGLLVHLQPLLSLNLGALFPF